MTPKDHDTPRSGQPRRWERTTYKVAMEVTLQDGRILVGHTLDVSLSGIFLKTITPPHADMVGLAGMTRVVGQPDMMEFPCIIVRASETGIGVQFHDKQAGFGMFVTHDMMLSLLTTINNSFAQTFDIDATLKIAVDIIKKHLQAEGASLFLVDEDGAGAGAGAGVVCKACAGPVDITGTRLKVGEGIVGRAITSGQPGIVHDVRDDTDFAAKVDAATGFETQAVLCAPLVIQDKVIGALEVVNKRGAGLFVGQDQVVLSALASATAMAIHNARQVANLVEMDRKHNDELRRRLEFQARTLVHNEKRFRDFASATSDWFWETDEEHRVTYLSDRFEAVTGRPSSAVIGKTRRELISQDELNGNREKWERHFQNLNDHRPFKNFEYEILPNFGGAIITIAVSGVPVFDDAGVFKGYRGSGEDVTKRKQMNDELRLARDVADKANHAKSEFLSSMSHELRTPLNAILGFGQLLQYNPKEPLLPGQKDAIDQIMKGGQHLLDLINDVLDLAKIEAGKVQLNFENVSVKAVMNECRPLIQTLADKKDIQLTVCSGFHADAHIHVDHVRFKQCLLNLMSNAVKYNRDGGAVIVDCKPTRSGMLRLAVNDTGFGIAADRFDELFKPFSRLDAENSEIEGTDIGLTITKQLIERMDGHIGVESVAGEGSTFWLDVPLSEQGVAPVPVDEQSDGDGILPSIVGTLLYVEDNPANLQLMEMIVERIDGLVMISAHNAELGLELARTQKPGMIILDINLPGMNGFEALAALKADEETKDIPVIALSANAMRHDIERGLEAGFEHYLTKPMRVEEVIKIMKDILERQRA